MEEVNLQHQQYSREQSVHFEQLMTGPIVGSFSSMGARERERDSESEKGKEGERDRGREAGTETGAERGGGTEGPEEDREKEDSGTGGSAALSFAHITQVGKKSVA